MPGSSLWLTPPRGHPLHAILSTLIESILPGLVATPDPAAAAPVFAPHLTLTSNIDPAVYASDPQAWLDSLPFARPLPLPTTTAASQPESEQQAQTVCFERVQSEDVFFRRCYIKCSLTDQVKHLAGVARAWGVNGDGTVVEGDRVVLGPQTQTWLAQWADAFGPHVSLMYGHARIDEIRLRHIERAVQEAGVGLHRQSAQVPTGWEGGVVWLVPTDRSIPEWSPIATRTL